MSLILDGTAGVTFPNSTVQASAGSVIQVVQATTSTTTSTSSQTFVNTNLTASITPKFSTSKILVLVSGSGTCGNTSGGVGYQILRGASIAFNPSAQDVGGHYFYSYGGGNYYPMQITYLDSPATTSALTYKVQIKLAINNYSNQITFLRNDNSANPIGTITLLEVSGS